MQDTFTVQHHVWLELTNQKKHNIEIALLVPESDRTFNRLASSENLLWVGHKAIATPMIMVKEEHGQPHQSQQHLNMVDLVAHHMDRKDMIPKMNIKRPRDLKERDLKKAKTGSSGTKKTPL
ncbi:uncharacterized protein LOC21397841 [Morus notabilis]|uniref:uncharacterized protein LOC21397841 n=1 Tax=Morus notabilis TaxID=981085 RepID=UPI000CED5C78|nr:uncharacterized protein LOC21397841 [Morus notabilis]